MQRELSRKGIKLDLLRNEYKVEHPDGYAYTWFCTRTHYIRWASALPLTLGQTHAPGEKLFVDYPGDRIAIIDTQTGEIHDAELNAVARRLNERPRKALNYETPAERFQQTTASTG
ncbi:hypothetical protein PQR57_46645 [Paraburkholderia dipogonis]|uniref:Transposase n=1 Tax=Paraburkholderia dipogonis TaxID=1211383 RepID=A0ABW9B615_9BURK